MRNARRYLIMAIIGLAFSMNGIALPIAYDSLTVSLITCYPGPQTYELYGHTAIRVKMQDDSGNRIDETFNYGAFDFNSPNFTYRFVKGTAMYMVVHYPFEYFLPEYMERGSKVVEQTLNLPKDKKNELLQLLLENCKPENREYRYDYIRDNCSTRPRDIIEAVVGESLEYNVAASGNKTYRNMMHDYDRNYAWQSFGIDLALGAELDEAADIRQQMFAPIYLEKALDKATYVDEEGNRVRLVSKTDTLCDGPDSGAILSPTPWWATPTALACMLLFAAMVATVADIRRRKVSRIFDTVMYLCYFSGGCIIWFLVFESVHAATGNNYNALWLHPFYIVPALLLWIKSARKVLYWYQIINFALLILTIAGWSMATQQGDTAIAVLMTVPAVRQFSYIYINHNQR